MVSRSDRRWLLPDALRRCVVLIDTAAAGSALLAWAGHAASRDLLTALGATAAAATLLALVPRRRPAPLARTVAAVLAASQQPAGRVQGRCTMLLRLNDADGSPRQFVHVEPSTPAATWPREGSRVVVVVARQRTPRVAVLWQLGVSHPVDDSALDEANLQALPRLESVDQGLTQDPSRLAQRYLVPTERFRAEWRRHGIRWVKQCAFGLAVALLLLSGYRVTVRDHVVGPGTLEQPELVAQVVWGVWLVWRGLAWLNTRLMLTSRRLILIYGLFWRRVASIPLAKAADVLHTKSPLGALMGYGTFRFSNVPVLRPLWRVADVPDARTVYLQIVGDTVDLQPPEQAYLPTEVEETLDGLLAIEAA